MNLIRIQRWRPVILGLFAIVALSMIWAPPASQAQSVSNRKTIRALFIGNSYTYYNNLGDIVSGIAAADHGGPTILPTLAVRGSATLKWHLEKGTAVKELAAGGWDHVVLQEHSLLGGRTVDGEAIMEDTGAFFASVREWVRRIRGAGANPILYMTWARRETPAKAAKMQQELADAYLTIGRELGVTVAPVGLAWAEVHRRLRTLDLHIYDGSHPTAAGSYLAACVIYSAITGRTPVGAPSVVRGRPMVDTAKGVVPDATLQVPLVDLPAATATALQETAWHISQQNVIK